MLGIEVGLVIVGVLALTRRRLPVTRTKVVLGTPARLLGLVALTPLPLAVLAGVLCAMSENSTEPTPPARIIWLLMGIELGISLCVAGIVFGVGALVAVRPNEAECR